MTRPRRSLSVVRIDCAEPCSTTYIAPHSGTRNSTAIRVSFWLMLRRALRRSAGRKQVVIGLAGLAGKGWQGIGFPPGYRLRFPGLKHEFRSF
ncbi:hypothetical protein D9M71_720510 [compost metagenome]